MTDFPSFSSQNNIPLYAWICHIFKNPFICLWTFHLFQKSWLLNMLQISLWNPDFKSFDYKPKSGIFGSYGSSIFNICAISVLFSIAAACSYLSTVYKSYFFHNPSYLCLIDNSQPYWCEWYLIVIFELDFSMINDIEHLLAYPSLSAILCFLWRNVHSSPFLFFNQIVYLFIVIKFVKFIYLEQQKDQNSKQSW